MEGKANHVFKYDIKFSSGRRFYENHNYRMREVGGLKLNSKEKFRYEMFSNDIDGC